jgi:Lrp/AsnC family leucine-responsive transcriptional regulator
MNNTDRQTVAKLAQREVLACHKLSGRYDDLIEAIAHDLQSFSPRVRVKICRLPRGKEMPTSIPLKEVKRAGMQSLV